MFCAVGRDYIQMEPGHDSCTWSTEGAIGAPAGRDPLRPGESQVGRASSEGNGSSRTPLGCKQREEPQNRTCEQTHTLTAMAGQLSPCSVPLATANRKELAGVSLSCEGVIPLQPYVLSPHAHSNAAPFLRRLSQPGSICASSLAGRCELRTTARSEAGWDTVWQVALLISQLCGTLFMETCVYPEGHENR